jgi:type I restriction enzyme S subunit
MEVKAGYKQTEVGLIPNDWEVKPLSILSKKITDGDHLTPIREKSGYLLLSARNIKNGKLALKDVDYVGRKEYLRMTTRCNPEFGDILISCSGHGLGKIAVVPEELKCVLVRSAALVKVNQSIANSVFLHFWLRSENAQKQISEGLSRAAQPNLFIGNIQKILAPIPPFYSEQQAIANALSDADALIESLEQLIERKRQIKQGVMQELLTGKRRLPGFSGEWGKKTFGEMFRISGGFSASRDQLGNKGICYLHYGDIHTTSKNNVDLSVDFASIPKLPINHSDVPTHSFLNDGDIVFVDASEDIEGASKYVVIDNPKNIPFIAGLHTIVAKAKGHDLDKHYARYAFKTPSVKEQFRFYAVGTKVSGVSKGNIVKISVQIPTTREQIAIAEILCNIDDQLILLNEKVDKAQQIKQAMMQDLLTGKVRLV